MLLDGWAVRGGSGEGEGPSRWQPFCCPQVLHFNPLDFLGMNKAQVHALLPFNDPEQVIGMGRKGDGVI